ncbi:MAG: hypothetical protein Q7Q73_09005 [Verrucomicrobiota bacterium JB024]|nr:hypothetical protein [Verrucomicrobiota bacterium JB024]
MMLTILLLCSLTRVSAGELPELDLNAAGVKNYKMGVATHFARKVDWMRPWEPSVLIPQIAELGVGWIRDEIMWYRVETKKGEYQVPAQTLEWLELANAHGLKVVACFAGENPLYDDHFDPEAYAKAAAWLAQELKGKVHAIEILNEPMSYYAAYYGEGGMRGGNWWGLDDAGDVYPWVRRYVRLLNASAEAIKTSNSDMPVIGLGAITPINFHMLQLGISPQVDGITIHPYSFRTPPEVIPWKPTPEFRQRHGFAVADSDSTFASMIDRYHEFSAQHGGPAQLWLTEWGYTTFREGATGKDYLYSGFSEEAQAKYTLRRFMECLALNIELSIQYAFMDDQHEGGQLNCESGFGLIRADHSRKPAFEVVQRLARTTVDYIPDDSLGVVVRPFSDRSEDRPLSWEGAPLPALQDIRHYQFLDAEGQSVIAIWSSERLSDLNVRATDIHISGVSPGVRVEAYDLYTGQAMALSGVQQDGDHVVLSAFPVPPYPVLITLKEMPAED